MLLKIFDLILAGITLTFLLQCFIAIFMGAFISISLILSGQTWAKSFSNITTFCILPIIGLVITTVISGNIALSLGMVGALSIIRFRHPVKSPLELSIYFLLLTVGITISAAIGKAIVLTIFSMIIIYSYSLYRKSRMLKNLGTSDISLYSEETKYLLEIICQEKNDYLSNNSFLLFSNENISSSKFIYKLCFNNKKDTDKFKNYIQSSLKGIEEIKYTRI